MSTPAAQKPRLNPVYKEDLERLGKKLTFDIQVFLRQSVHDSIFLISSPMIRETTRDCLCSYIGSSVNIIIELENL